MKITILLQNNYQNHHENPTNLKKDLINIPSPNNIPPTIIDDADFINLPKKETKLKGKIKQINITEFELKSDIRKSWNKFNSIPGVVLKKNKYYIEFKQIIELTNENICIGVSCQYNFNNDEWEIKCIDMDLKRMYYQHRLMGLKNDHDWHTQYSQFAQFNSYTKTKYELYIK